MNGKKWLTALGAAAILSGLALFTTVGDAPLREGALGPPGPAMDLSSFSADPPRKKLSVLFIHHSVGGQLLADPGPEAGEGAIYLTHPNGGGLRSMLTGAGYAVHEASYGSALGERTDLFDWLPKLRGQMDLALSTAHQDRLLPAGERNDIVMFKSCFPNSEFVGEGASPGRPEGPELTLENAKAAMRAVRDQLEKRPETLFVYLTAPPLAPKPWRQPLWKLLIKGALGRLPDRAALTRSGPLARQFNDWMKSPAGWLAGYPHRNVVVFDYHDVLTGAGRSNFSAYATFGGADSHPSREGNARAAAELVPFLNRAVRRAGLSP